MKDMIDISFLPEEYKKEVVDYYNFVVAKYNKEKRESGIDKVGKIEDDLLPKKVKKFIPMEKDEIYGG